jgi:hypothetical protein
VRTVDNGRELFNNNALGADTMNNNVVATVRATVKGTTPVSIESVTVPKMRKTGNPFNGKEVLKHATMFGLMGFDYENSVNSLARKEGKEEREAKPRAWGKLTSDRLFVEHKGQHYLRMKVQGTKNIRYTVDGVETPKSELEAWLPKPRKSSTQADLVGEVVERDIKLENVKAMRFKGMEIK